MYIKEYSLQQGKSQWKMTVARKNKFASKEGLTTLQNSYPLAKITFIKTVKK